MAVTIEGVFEIVSSHLVEERTNQFRSGNVGLGPDDLVELFKYGKGGGFGPESVRKYYHQVIGLSSDSLASFSAYFAELMLIQEANPFFSMAPSVKITRCQFYIWNSFTNVETTVSILPSGKVECFSTTVSAQKIPISPEDWNLLRLSSALRYRRMSQPLLFSFFGSFPLPAIACRAVPCPPLSYEDLCLIAEKHPVSDELQFAIATSMIVSLPSNRVIDFLSKYSMRLTLLSQFLLRFVKKSSSLALSIAEEAEFELERFPDNLSLAISICEVYIACGKVDLCSRHLILLYQSIWCTPDAPICCANICTERGDFKHAFCFLNLSFYSRNWPEEDIIAQTGETTHPIKAIERGPSRIETRLIASPLVGSSADLFSCAAKLISTAGKQTFESIFDEYSKTHSLKSRERNVCQWPVRQTERQSQSDEGLYDPGIDFDISEIGSYEKLPLSRTFAETIADVEKMIEKYEWQPAAGTEPQVLDITHALVSGIRLNDSKLIDSAFRAVTSSQDYRGLDKMLLLYAHIHGIGPAYEEIMKLIPPRITMTEKNSIEVMSEIAAAVDRF